MAEGNDNYDLNGGPEVHRVSEVGQANECAMEIFITVVENEGDEELVELPLEEDGKTLSLGTLQGQFPGSCGLKYRSPETGAWRGLRVTNGIVSPSNNDWGLGDRVYVVVYPKAENKRKGEGEEEEAPKKRVAKKAKPPAPEDLIIKNLPFALEEDGLKAYFETFGELVVTQLKKDLEGKSRGFGFIRYQSLEDQARCLSERHYIDGRAVEVKLSRPKTAGLDEVVYPGAHLSRRIFVGRVTQDVGKEDLEAYFGKYGAIADVFVPNPFRMFAFVTFVDAEDAASLIESGDDHLIKGCSVTVSYASPMKPNEKGRNKGQGNDREDGPKMMPDNPMEAMGMAMAMMNSWQEDKRKSGGRGGGGGGRGRGGYGGGYGGGGYGGGYGQQGGNSWNSGGYQGGYGAGSGSWY